MPSKNELNIDLMVSAEQWHSLDDLEPLVQTAAGAAFEKVSRIIGAQGSLEVVVNLSNDAAITKLNHDFRGKNKPTNVLSFPFEDEFSQLAPGPKPLGDIMLSFETIQRESDKQGIELRHHIAHLVVHGVLHLFGYDHNREEEAREMEELETDILASLNIASPYRAD